MKLPFGAARTCPFFVLIFTDTPHNSSSAVFEEKTLSFIVQAHPFLKYGIQSINFLSSGLYCIGISFDKYNLTRHVSFFVVPFDEDEKDPSVWFLDHDYLENMYGMFKKVNGRCIIH